MIIYVYLILGNGLALVVDKLSCVSNAKLSRPLLPDMKGAQHWVFSLCQSQNQNHQIISNNISIYARINVYVICINVYVYNIYMCVCVCVFHFVPTCSKYDPPFRSVQDGKELVKKVRYNKATGNAWHWEHRLRAPAMPPGCGAEAIPVRLAKKWLPVLDRGWPSWSQLMPARGATTVPLLDF